MARYVANIEKIDIEKALIEAQGEGYEESKTHKINNDTDLFNVKNRIILIVRYILV